MSEPIENQYFNWLYTKVCDTNTHSPSLGYVKLLRQLHRTEFVWLLTGDDNRAEDGCDLRGEFLSDAFMRTDNEHWLLEGCSVLEMLIAFSRRASFETDDSPRDWFWKLLDNLRLTEFTDATRVNSAVVQDILDRFIWRTYHFNGDGGLFPLDYTTNDQRGIEIWYQFSEYVAEKDLI